MRVTAKSETRRENKEKPLGKEGHHKRENEVNTTSVATATNITDQGENLNQIATPEAKRPHKLVRGSVPDKQRREYDPSNIVPFKRRGPLSNGNGQDTPS